MVELDLEVPPQKEVQRFDEENDVVYIWYFKDRAVYGLDATGALVDGVIRPA